MMGEEEGKGPIQVRQIKLNQRHLPLMNSFCQRSDSETALSVRLRHLLMVENEVTDLDTSEVATSSSQDSVAR